MAYRDVRLGGLLESNLHGVPLDLVAALMPPRTRMKAGLQMHIRMHANSQRRHELDGASSDSSERSFSARAFRGLIESLRKAVGGLPSAAGRSSWAGYEDASDHYSDTARERKMRLVSEWIDRISPSTVWDLGASTGRFARISSSRLIDTLALDIDPFCVDAMYRTARESDDRHLTPLVQDLANPSPGIGWANEERLSFVERGPEDLVLALPLTHHLAIGRNVPLAGILEYLSRLGKAAIVEFVPKDDPKVRQLLRQREDVFVDYTVDVFESEAAARFVDLGS